MTTISHIVGNLKSKNDKQGAGTVQGREIDYVDVTGEDASRSRFRTSTRSGRPLTIALPRGETLSDGDILQVDDDAAIVASVEQPRWARFTPKTLESALHLGFKAGHLHWKVRFNGPCMEVLLEAELNEYLDRLLPEVTQHVVEVEVTSES